MSQSERIEAFEECEFWAQCAGDERPLAKNYFAIAYWYAHAVLKHVYIYMRKPRQWNETKKLKDKACDLLIIHLTKNQKYAVAGILNNNQRYLTCSSEEECDIRIPWGRLALLTLKKITPLFVEMNERGIAKNYGPWIDELARFSAGKVIAKELLTRVNPLAILISNDHSGISRSIIKVAQEKNIKVIYTQHGQIGNCFPKLNYDLTMLDGMQAFDKYIDSGKPNGVIVITGRRKITKSSCKEKSKSDQIRIGICTNNLDEIKLWDKLIKQLKEVNYTLILRPHPGDRRQKKWKKMSIKNEINYNDSILSDFLDEVDLIITGESGVVLDAYAKNLSSIIMKPRQLKSKRMSDYYGFLKFSIAEECQDIKRINELVKTQIRKQTNINKLSIFDAGTLINPEKEKNDAIEKFIRMTKNEIKFEEMMDGKIKSYYRGVEYFALKEYIESMDEALNMQANGQRF